MAEKKTAKKENSQVDLEEILGDIKTVVSGDPVKTGSPQPMALEACWFSQGPNIEIVVDTSIDFKEILWGIEDI